MVVIIINLLQKLFFLLNMINQLFQNHLFMQLHLLLYNQIYIPLKFTIIFYYNENNQLLMKLHLNF